MPFASIGNKWTKWNFIAIYKHSYAKILYMFYVEKKVEYKAWAIVITAIRKCGRLSTELVNISR